MITDAELGLFYLIFFFVFLFALAALAFVPGSIAERKGQSFWGFWLFGFFFFPWAVQTALLMQAKPDYVHKKGDRGALIITVVIVAIAVPVLGFVVYVLTL